MGRMWLQMCRKRGRIALLLLCLLATGTVQIVAATHWHAASTTASNAESGQRQPGSNGLDPDGCLLCQVAAHAASVAPPSAPWSVVALYDIRISSSTAAVRVAVIPRPSHSWQGRAPPAV